MSRAVKKLTTKPGAPALYLVTTDTGDVEVTRDEAAVSADRCPQWRHTLASIDSYGGAA